MDIKEDVHVGDQIKITVDIAVGPPRYSKVKVLAEGGIFKNGVQHNQGDEAIIEKNAAEGYEKIGEVEIIGPAKLPKEESQDADDSNK